MTTIVYSNDVLAADSLHVNVGNEQIFFKQKLKISKDKHLAYALAGQKPVFNGALEDWVYKSLLEVLNGSPFVPIPECSFQILGMTSNLTFVIYNNAMQLNCLNLIDPTDDFVLGTGGCVYSTVTLRKNKDAVEAVKFACLYDVVSGGDIHAVKRSSLKPMRKTK